MRWRITHGVREQRGVVLAATLLTMADTLFNTSIPPGTPRGILTMKGRWSQA